MTLDNFKSTNFQDDILNYNNYDFSYAEIHSTYNNHNATFYIFSDALKIENIRVNTSAITMQKIADKLNCILPTAKLYDLAYQQSTIKIPPSPQSISSTKESMINHSKRIDALLKDKSYNIASTVGKVYILDNDIKNSSCNYGWHFIGNSFQGITGGNAVSIPYKMIQSRGFHHDNLWVDYSQICVLVARECLVDGNSIDILDLLKSDLAILANHSGKLNYTRVPLT